MEDPTPCPLRDSPGFEPGTTSMAVSSSTSGENGELESQTLRGGPSRLPNGARTLAGSFSTPVPRELGTGCCAVSAWGTPG
jgi:hypothetical protein